MQTPPPPTDNTWILSTIVIVGAVLVLFVNYLIWKNRKMKGDYVFRASRLTKGNRLFPAQVVVTPTSVTRVQPQWIGKNEESVHIAHISSTEIDTDMIFAKISIETSGHNPLVCNGLKKGDSVKLKGLIERLQSEHYRNRDSAGAATRP